MTLGASVAHQVVTALRAQGRSIAVAESLTGGLVAAEFVGVPGASVVFHGGVVAYRDEVKRGVLGVSSAVLAEHGAVSAQVAQEMAAGVALVCAADVGVSTTGVAGPGSCDGLSAGTVYTCVWGAGQGHVVHHHFAGDRSVVRRAATESAMQQVLDFVTVAD